MLSKRWTFAGSGKNQPEERFEICDPETATCCFGIVFDSVWLDAEIRPCPVAFRVWFDLSVLMDVHLFFQLVQPVDDLLQGLPECIR